MNTLVTSANKIKINIRPSEKVIHYIINNECHKIETCGTKPIYTHRPRSYTRAYLTNGPNLLPQ